MATSQRTPFYLTLVSNASTNLYPSNKPQSFKVELCSPISFDGKWEVALCEYFYPNNMLNIPDDTVIKILLKKDEIAKVDSDRTIATQLRRPTLDSNPATSVMFRSTEQEGSDSKATQPEGDDSTKTDAILVTAAATRDDFISNLKDKDIAIPVDEKVSSVEEEEEEEEEEVDQGLQELISFQSSSVYSMIDNDISFRATIPKGKFDSIIDLCGYINRSVMKSYREVQTIAGITADKHHIFQPIRFFLESTDNRVYIVSQYRQTQVQFKSEAYLPFVLGLTTSKTSPISTYNTPYIGTDEPSLNQNYPAMFLYTNIIEFTMVGDTLAPLLRTVAIKTNEKDDVISKVFNSPFYHELNKNYIKTIEIEIRNDAGDAIHFQKGKTVLVLHFRPRTLL